MATTFLEPGGDADFLVGTTNGFWSAISGSPTIATDFVHGNHIKSIRLIPNSSNGVKTTVGSLADSGSRFSLYMYFVAFTGDASNPGIILQAQQSGGVTISFQIKVKSTGVIVLYNDATTQLGSDGPTLSTGQWYRISLAYTIASTSVNEFRLFVDGVSAVSVTNATLANVTTSILTIRNSQPSVLMDCRISDIYVDNSSSLTDPGNIWVTAKRPNANGTANNFSTQIGSGGSSYGSGHSPQVNERALDTANGWSMVGAGSAVVEEYNIETKSIGDIGIVDSIIDYVGWVSCKALVGETANIILNGVSFAQAITSTITLYTKVAGSTSYPAGSGADIGLQTDTSLTTVSLYECGVIVAFIPPSVHGTIGNAFRHVSVGGGMSRNEGAT